MKDCKLVLPSEDHLMSYLTLCRELKQSGSRFFSFNDPDEFETWRHTLLQAYEDQRKGENLPEDYVPCTHFWLIQGDELIGSVSLRHVLNERLKQLGGHIGYAIKPSKWNQGYGTLQLKLALEQARKLGIERALLTCDEENVGSARVMEKNGGVHQDTIDNTVDGETRRTRRYWIEIQPDPLHGATMGL